MSRWTEDEFQRVANNTRLSTRTLAACRDVMVHGLTGVDAGKAHDVLPAQISRATANLRAKHEELVKSVALMRSSSSEMKAIAFSQAQKLAIFGNLPVVDAEIGQSYIGPCAGVTPGFVIQRVNEPTKCLVIHDLGKLATGPDINKRMAISYPKDGGLASVGVSDNRRATDVEVGGGGVER